MEHGLSLFIATSITRLLDLTSSERILCSLQLESKLLQSHFAVSTFLIPFPSRQEIAHDGSTQLTAPRQYGLLLKLYSQSYPLLIIQSTRKKLNVCDVVSSNSTATDQVPPSLFTQARRVQRLTDRTTGSRRVSVDSSDCE